MLNIILITKYSNNTITLLIFGYIKD